MSEGQQVKSTWHMWVSGWQEELGSRKTQIGIPALLFTDCLTLGMLLNLSRLLFSHAKNDDFNTFVYWMSIMCQHWCRCWVYESEWKACRSQGLGVLDQWLEGLFQCKEKTSEEGISKEAMGLRLESNQDTAEEGVTGRFQAEATVCLYEGLEVNGDPC